MIHLKIRVLNLSTAHVIHGLWIVSTSILEISDHIKPQSMCLFAN